MNIRIARGQVCVMLLNHSDAIAQPFTDFENGLSGTGEDRRKTVAHHMRRNPRATLFFHIFRKGAAKIVAIPPNALPDFRHQGEVIGRFAFQVLSQEFLEWSGEGDTALLAIFRPECRGLENMEAVPVKPVDASLVNLSPTQSGIEAAKQDESQIIGFRFGDQLVFVLFGAKPESPLGFMAGEHDLGSRVVEPGPLDINAPPEKAAKRHHVALRGGFRYARLEAAVEALDVLPVHTARRERCGHAGRELEQRNELCGGALVGILIHAEFVGDEAPNLCLQILVRSDEGIANDLGSFADRFALVSGIQIHPFSDAADLPSKPVRAAFQVKIPDSVHTEAFTDRHLETRKFSVKLADESCAMQGSNLRPLPCQGRGVRRGVHRLAFTNHSLAKKLPVEGTVTLQTSRSLYFLSRENTRGGWFYNNLSGGVESSGNRNRTQQKTCPATEVAPSRDSEGCASPAQFNLPVPVLAERPRSQGCPGVTGKCRGGAYEARESTSDKLLVGSQPINSRGGQFICNEEFLASTICRTWAGFTVGLFLTQIPLLPLYDYTADKKKAL